MQNLLPSGKIVLLALTAGIFSATQSLAQTIPVARSLPYTQDFSSLAHSSTVYPDGWQGWNLNSSTGSTTSFRTTAPIANMTLLAASDASVNAGGVHNYNGKIGFMAKNNGSKADPAICLAISTTGQSNIKVVFDVMTISNPYGGANTHINNVELQYRIGNTVGAFISLSGSMYSNNTTQQLSGTTPQKIENKVFQLPAACENQAVVQLRWVQRDETGGGNPRPSFALDNISICGIPDITPNGTTAICTGDSTILTASSGASYLWSTGATSQSISVSAAGNYNCTVTQAGGCSNTSPSTAISLLPLPTVSISASQATVLCPGCQIDLVASGASSYLWDGNAGSATTSSVSVAPVSSSSYSVIGIDDNGCRSAAVQPISVGSLSSSIAASSCNITVSNLNKLYSISNAVGATSVVYSFVPSDGGPVITKTVSPFSTLLNLGSVSGLQYNKTYSVTVQPFQGSTGGCISSASTLSISSPVVYLTIGCNSNISNLNTNLQCSVCPGATDVTWMFTPAGGGTAITKTVSPFVNNLNLATVGGLQYGQSYNVQVQASANGLPGPISSPCVLNIISPSISVYKGCGYNYTNLNQTIMSSVCPGATSIDWLFTPVGGGTPVTKSISPFTNSLSLATVTGLQYGTSYDVQVRASAGAVIGSFSSPCQINILAPAVSVFYGCGKTFSNLNATIQSSVCPGATSIDWMFTPTGGGTPITKTVSPFSSYLNLSTVAGLAMGNSYVVQVRATSGTSVGNYSSSSCIITLGSTAGKLAGTNPDEENGPDKEVTTAAAEIEKVMIEPERLSVYPNPSSGSISIDIKEPSQVSVYNVLGELVYAEQKQAGLAQLDLKMFGNGIYYVVVTRRTGLRVSEKVVITD